MRVSIRSILSMVLIAALGACGDGGHPVPATKTNAAAPPPSTAPTVTSPAGPAPGDAKAPAVNAEESRYLSEALRQGMGQIELAESVSRRSRSKAVAALAREIVAAHDEINADLTRIAFASSVTLPNDAAPVARETKARLERLDGRELDAAYLADLLQMYPDLVRLHGSAATTATNMDLKKVAVRARVLFERNLRQARDAYAQVTGTVLPREPEPGSVPPAGSEDER